MISMSGVKSSTVPARRRPISLLTHMPMEMSLAAVVQHLQILEEAGLVKTEKVGRVRSCRVDAAGLDAARDWLGARRPEWERAMDRLGDLLAESDETPISERR